MKAGIPRRLRPGARVKKPGYNLANHSALFAPWRANAGKVFDAQGAWIATTGDAPIARLIAAAPDLLAVVERMEESCAAMVERGEDCDPYDMAEAFMTEARAALAKAKGQ